MWIARGEDGQATVELVALLPALALVAALAWQALLAGETWWLAGAAAREGARARALGDDPRAAARGVLPSGRLRGGLRVVGDGEDGGVRVRLAVPSIVPGARLGSVTVRARMEPQS
jgi:pilus assembly protein CpaE